MATFNELEKEVRVLRNRLRKLEGGNAEAAQRTQLNELVAPGDDVRVRTSGGFAAACAESRATVIEQQKQQAREELRANPSAINSRSAQVAFRRTYAAVPTAVLNEIIREMT